MTTVSEHMTPQEPIPPLPVAGDPDSTADSRSTSRGPNILIGVATVLAIVTVLSVWARTQVLDTEEWVRLSTELLEQPEVQEALSIYLVEQVYADDKVTTGLQELLPEDLSGLAGPLAGALRGPVTNGVESLLASDRFQQLWETANREAHRTLVTVLRGEDLAGLSTADGTVMIELRPLVVAAGETVGLPKDRLDAIPPDAGQIVIFESGDLAAVQGVIATFEFLAWFLFVVVAALYAIAVYLATGRRMKALRNVGLSLIVVGVVIISAQAIAIRALADALVDPSGRPTADAVGTVGTGLLRQQGWSAVIYGLLIAGFAALRGDRRSAVATRRTLAPALNASLGALAAGIAVFLLLLIWWSPGRAFEGWTTGLLLVALIIGGVAALRAQTQREFPDASFEDVLGGLRNRLTT